MSSYDDDSIQLNESNISAGVTEGKDTRKKMNKLIEKQSDEPDAQSENEKDIELDIEELKIGDIAIKNEERPTGRHQDAKRINLASSVVE